MATANLKKQIQAIVAVTLTLSLISQSALASPGDASTPMPSESVSQANWETVAEQVAPRFGSNTGLSYRADKSALTAKELDEKIAAKPSGPTLFGNVGRVLIILHTVNGIDIVRRKITQLQLSGRRITRNDIREMADDAANRVVNNPQVWVSIANEQGIHKAVGKVGPILNKVLSNALTKQVYVKMLSSSIITSFYFVGFNVLGQLWEEARLLLPTREEYDIAGRVSTMAHHDLVELTSRGRHTKEGVVALHVLTNMARILIFDEELQRSFFYNTWRLRLAQGGITSFIAIVTSTSLLGSAMFPGAGTVAGFMFGLTGFMIASNIPGEYYDALTDQIKAARITYRRVSLSNARGRLVMSLDKFRYPNVFYLVHPDEKKIETLFDAARTERQFLATVLIERSQMMTWRIHALEQEIGLLRERLASPSLSMTSRRKAEAGITKRLSLLKPVNDERTKTLVRLVSIYSSEQSLLAALSRLTANKLPASIAKRLQVEERSASVLKDFMQTLAGELQISSPTGSAERVQQDLYYRAVNEKKLVNAILAPASAGWSAAR